MKVIRVTNKYHQNPQSPIIEVGTETNVVSEKVNPADGGLMYQVDAVPPKLIGNYLLVYYYDATGFAILPEPDSDQMKEDVREAIVNIETELV
jgi:hypothetical protein